MSKCGDINDFNQPYLVTFVLLKAKVAHKDLITTSLVYHYLVIYLEINSLFMIRKHYEPLKQVWARVLVVILFVVVVGFM